MLCGTFAAVINLNGSEHAVTLHLQGLHDQDRHQRKKGQNGRNRENR